MALTRARHQVVIWWVRAYDSQHSPLGRLLMCRDPAGNVAASATYSPNEAAVQARLEQWPPGVLVSISVERCTAAHRPVGTGRPAGPATLRPPASSAAWTGRWRRTSYSGITAADHSEAVGSEPEPPGSPTSPTKQALHVRRPRGSGRLAQHLGGDPELGGEAGRH